jgi:predicted membrane protein
MGLGVSAVYRVLSAVFFFNIFCLLVFGFLCILLVCLGAPYAFYIFLLLPIKKKKLMFVARPKSVLELYRKNLRKGWFDLSFYSRDLVA